MYEPRLENFLLIAQKGFFKTYMDSITQGSPRDSLRTLLETQVLARWAHTWTLKILLRVEQCPDDKYNLLPSLYDVLRIPASFIFYLHIEARFSVFGPKFTSRGS
jgi:hypothetical protein